MPKYDILISLMTSNKHYAYFMGCKVGIVLEVSLWHYNEVIMSVMEYQITGVSIVYSTLCSGADQRKHQSSASLDFARGSISGRWMPLTKDQKRYPFDDVIMRTLLYMGVQFNIFIVSTASSL